MIKEDAWTLVFDTGQTYIDKTTILLFLEHKIKDGHLQSKNIDREYIGYKKIPIRCRSFEVYIECVIGTENSWVQIPFMHLSYTSSV